MIVMKFGGTSVGDASRIAAACEIVRAHLRQRPAVVVSALAGVTDLLRKAIAAARAGDRETIETHLADLERRHRWALAAVQDQRRRHDLSLEVDALFEDLRQLFRSVRILGEGTPRAADALLAFGEALSSRILVCALRDRGIPARWIDPREVMITNGRHGAAEPDLDAVELRGRAAVHPVLEAEEIPVMGGFVGATPEGVTTTLGRGGSDTSAAALGSALRAEEIQIWTDVDGLMSADPKLVPAARTLETVSFAEAKELADYGARVLHPGSIGPAVRRHIPIRILNSLRPDGAGTRIMGEPLALAPPIASVASRGGVRTLRIAGVEGRMEAGLLPRALAALDREGIVLDLVVSSRVGATLAVQGGEDLSGVERALGGEARVETGPSRAILCVVGSALGRDAAVRARVLSSLAELEPEMVALGGSGSSAAAVIPEARLEESVRALHRRFFEEDGWA